MQNDAPRWLTSIFFLGFVLVGVTIYDDYGVSWDESISRTNGLVNLKFLYEFLNLPAPSAEVLEAPSLATWQDRDYGVAWELPAIILEFLFGKHEKDIADIFAFRHLLTFLFSALGAFAVYAIALKRFASRWYGLTAATLIILTPRMFAESFYNSKDIVFMAAFALAILTMLKFLRKPTIRIAVLHGFATAFAIDVRVMGIILVLTTLCALVLNLSKGWYRASVTFNMGIVYLVSTVGFTIAMFPYLWSDPINNFVNVLSSMSKFRWDNAVLYRGQVQSATNLPWHYSLVWVAITTPIVIMALTITGSIRTLFSFLSSPTRLWNTPEEMCDYIMLGLISITLVTVVALDSVLYDGWRQLYFIYPPMIILAVNGIFSFLEILSKYSLYKLIFKIFIIIPLAWQVVWIWKSHPHNNVYFNVLASTPWNKNFETDYWGLSNKAALLYIAADDSRSLVPVGAVSSTNLVAALNGLDQATRSRFALEHYVRKRYLIDNFRPMNSDINTNNVNNEREFDGYELVHVLKVSGQPIVRIHRLKTELDNKTITRNFEPYSVQTIQALEIKFLGFNKGLQSTTANIQFINNGSTKIAALSGIMAEVAVSWQFSNSERQSPNFWNNRLNLPFDLEPGESVEFNIELNDIPDWANTLEVSFVQDQHFWAHDIGITPLKISLRSLIP